MARWPAHPSLGAPGPGPCSRASPPAPRITSGQIQRDVLLAAVIPPCAKQTHKPRLGSIAGRRRPSSSPPPQGPGQVEHRGGGHRARGVARAAAGFTSYSEVLQRAAAADRRHIDGFQSQHRKPRPIAREPLPLPARRSRPPLPAPRRRPRPSARRVVRGRGATRRGAGVGCGTRGAEMGRASERRRGGRRLSHGGFPLMWSGVRALARPWAGTRAAGHLLNRPARSHSPRGFKARFLTHRQQLFLFKKEKREERGGEGDGGKRCALLGRSL